MKRFFYILLILSVIASCAKNMSDNTSPLPKAKDRQIINLTKAQEEYVKIGNNVSLALLNDIYVFNEGGSFVFSPLSIEYMLTMLANGAQGQTLKEIMDFLHFGSYDIDGLNEYYRILFNEFPQLDNTVTFSTANAIIYNTDHGRIMDSYASNMNNYYDALIKGLSFSSEDVLSYVNNWVTSKTNGFIDNIIEKVSPLTACCLLNALYFEGNWNSTVSFDPLKTERNLFTQNNGKTSKVEYMHLDSKIGYYKHSDYSAIRLNYGNGAFCYDVLLPNDGTSLSEIVSTLQVQDAPNIFLDTRTVSLSLPKYSTSIKTDLIKILIKYIPSSFSFNADFSLIASGPLSIGDFYQKTKTDINEKGTISAAVTNTSFIGTASPPGTPDIPVEFNANRPFIYLIRETSTNAIIMMGVYNGD